MTKKHSRPLKRWLVENAAQADLDPLALLIREVRRAHGWSQRAVADAMTAAGGYGVQALVHRLEDGGRPVPIEQVTALAIALGFGAGAKLAAFVELVAMSNLLRGIERHERRSKSRTAAGKQANLALRKRMAVIVRSLMPTARSAK